MPSGITASSLADRFSLVRGRDHAIYSGGMLSGSQRRVSSHEELEPSLPRVAWSLSRCYSRVVVLLLPLDLERKVCTAKRLDLERVDPNHHTKADTLTEARPNAANLMTKEEARKIAVGIAKLPGLRRRLARDRAASAFHWANNLIRISLNLYAISLDSGCLATASDYCQILAANLCSRHGNALAIPRRAIRS
jgi:hypothetical protein